MVLIQDKGGIGITGTNSRDLDVPLYTLPHNDDIGLKDPIRLTGRIYTGRHEIRYLMEKPSMDSDGIRCIGNTPASVYIAGKPVYTAEQVRCTGESCQHHIRV